MVTRVIPLLKVYSREPITIALVDKRLELSAPVTPGSAAVGIQISHYITQVGQYGSRKAENSKQASSTASSDDQKGFSGLKDIQVGSKICLELEKNSCGTRQSRNLEKYVLNRAQKNLRRKLQVFCIGGTVALRSPIPTF